MEGPVRPGVPPTVQAVEGEDFELGPPSGPKVGLVTLGCDKNTVDSERMLGALVAAGNGDFVVEALTSDGGTTFVPVEPGMFADGLVEVTGIQPGTQVVVP